MAEKPGQLWKILAVLLLPVSVLLVFWPVLHYGFINYDDPTYVSENPVVAGGLTWAGIKWAFTTFYGGNWHPLTWLSHMLDWQLYGTKPGLHHLTNLLLHTANALLLLQIIHRITGTFWRSLLVAALFALHPLHVESVAWLSERKDVLSTFFFMLTLWSYIRYALNSQLSTLNYLLSILFFTLGLLAKPMLVTLPFVLLLIDIWPLQRWQPLNPQSAIRNPQFLEKIPFFLLTAIACIITILAQNSGHTITSLQKSGLGSRLANVVVAYADYLGKTIWPARLAVFYPHVEFPSAAKLAAATVALIIGSVLAWRAFRTKPYWLIGWLWFLGTLFPVIGIVQIGQAAMADRYSYVPLIGLFMAAAWGLTDFLQQHPKKFGVVSGATIAVIIACAVTAHQQVTHWQSTETLFRHADEVTEKNHLAKTELGLILDHQGKNAEARQYYLDAIKAKPDFAEAHFCLANVFLNDHKSAEAIAEFREAIRCDPYYFEPRRFLGLIFAGQGRCLEAVEQLHAAELLSLGDFDVSLNLGNCLLATGNTAEAIPQFREALRLKPNSVEVLGRLAWLLATDADAKNRDAADAIRLARHACDLTTNKDPRSLLSLSASLAEAGQFPEALTTVNQATAAAQSSGQTGLTNILNHLSELFHAGKPFHEDKPN